MSRIEQLAANYQRHIHSPWRHTIAGAQRVVIVVYDKELERAFRARKAEFEQRTRAEGHGWVEYDCTRSFAEWMAQDDYREEYFRHPDDLGLKLDSEFADYVAGALRALL